MGPTVLDLVARTIGWVERRSAGGRGRPPVPTAAMVRALVAFTRGGRRWEVLLATPGRARGSTLRRRLMAWSRQAVLARVHLVLLRMARSAAAARAWTLWWTVYRSGPSAGAS